MYHGCSRFNAILKRSSCEIDSIFLVEVGIKAYSAIYRKLRGAEKFIINFYYYYSMPTEDSEIEKEKLKLDREKFVFEQEKFRETQETEKFKAWLLFIPLFVAILTIAYSSYSYNQEAKDNFKLKAADIVMDSEGPTSTYHKSLAMKELFKDSLPDDFATSFDPTDRKFGGPSSSVDSKKELLKLIVENPNFDKNETIQMWGDLFPGDKWIDSLRKSEALKSNDSLVGNQTKIYPWLIKR
ncbi:MAG: hypothetical protein EHM20_11955 [Alphaproteobacteria bacterium]|nr:MAG: hypothetical protein EHM20_11955 [Alphaproteobacteria bacterium]